MTSYKSVYDLLGNAAKGSMFRGEIVGSDKAVDNLNHYDGEKEEVDCISLTERNLLCGLNMPDNFTSLHDRDNMLRINCVAVSSSENTGSGFRNLSYTKEIDLNPFDAIPWKFVAEPTSVRYSSQVGLTVEHDKAFVAKVKALCVNMSDGQTNSLPMRLIGERITQGASMHHMLIKAYLMLMDLNLSVVMREERREAVMNNISPISERQGNDLRLGTIATRDVVIDSEGFTPEEIGLLCMMNWQYPSIKYCRDNIYNSCHMDADNLAIVSRGRVDVNRDMMMTPQEMYRNIISVCCKLDCLDDWHDVLRLMRGKPKHMADVCMLMGKVRVNTGVPKSVHFKRSLGGSNMFDIVPASYPMYIASSVGLVADMLLGSAYETVATLFVERVGGFGKAICDDDDPSQSGRYNSLLRDYGLSSMNSYTNAIMIDWENLSSCPYMWSISQTWKEYIIRLTRRMKMGGDILIPQLCYDIPYSNFQDTVWGAMRGWRGFNGAGVSAFVGFEDQKKLRDERLRLTAAFTWSMGVRYARPKVYANSFGSKEVSLSSQEMNWLSGAVGSHRLTHVSYTLREEYKGREDWTERAASSTIRSVIDGTKCSVIISDTEQVWRKLLVKVDGGSDIEGKGQISETLGMRPRESDMEQLEVDEILAMTMGRNQSKGKDDTLSDIFKSVKSIVKPRQKIGIKKAEMATVKDSSKMSIHDVPGDGKCGIHAVVKSMMLVGVVDPSDAEKVFNNFDGALKDETFHDASSIAGALLEFGIPMRLYNEEDNGDITVWDYGEVEQGGIPIFRRGNHFSAVVEGEGEYVRVKSRHKGVAGEDCLKQINEMRRFFE